MNHLLSLDQILSIPLPAPRLALDKSVRRVDQDGHLHVGASILSSAAVNPYWGSEVPDYQKLGLQAERRYDLLRDPDELRRAAPSFVGKPLLSLHRPLTAADHAPALTVGSIGSPVTFDGNDLVGPLVVWDGDAIAAIQDGSVKALSCGYRYVADMTPGTWNGQRYDGVMRDIAGNHVALVEAGRVSGAVVGDAALRNNAVNGLPVEGDVMDLDQIRKFCAGKLSDADMQQLNALLAELAPPSDGIVLDGAMRRSGAREGRRDDARWVRQFPGLAKLKTRPWGAC